METALFGGQLPARLRARARKQGVRVDAHLSVELLLQRPAQALPLLPAHRLLLGERRIRIVLPQIEKDASLIPAACHHPFAVAAADESLEWIVILLARGIPSSASNDLLSKFKAFLADNSLPLVSREVYGALRWILR